MSSEERNRWISIVSAVVVAIWYFGGLMGEVADTPVPDIAYGGRILKAVGISIVISIVGGIFLGIAFYRDGEGTDERDRSIERLGNSVQSYLLGFGMLVPLWMAIKEQEHFWIAQAMMAVFFVSDFIASGIKVRAYRRGF